MSNSVYHFPLVQGGVLPESRTYLGVVSIPHGNKDAVGEIVRYVRQNHSCLIGLFQVGSGIAYDAHYIIANQELNKTERVEAIKLIENIIGSLRDNDGLDVQYKYTPTPYKNSGFTVEARLETVSIIETIYDENMIPIIEKGDMLVSGSKRFKEITKKLDDLYEDSWTQFALWGTWELGV